MSSPKGKSNDSITWETNARILAAHNVPSFIAEFKVGVEAAEVQLASYFMRLARKADEDIFLGRRLLALGLLIRGAMGYPSSFLVVYLTKPIIVSGPTISFHGLAMVDDQVRC